MNNECLGCVHAGETHFSNRFYHMRGWLGNIKENVGNCRYCSRNPNRRSRGLWGIRDHYQSKADVARLKARKRGWGQGAKDDGHHRPGPPHPTRRELKIIGRDERRSR